MERLFVTLLVKLGVVASLASILVRPTAVQRMLLRENRTLNQRLQLALWFSGVFATGVATRVLATRVLTKPSRLRGRRSGPGGQLARWNPGRLRGRPGFLGILISVPAMFNHEYLSMPLFAAIGVLGGLLRDVATDTEDIWRFSPFFDLNLYRFFKQRNYRRGAFHLLFLFDHSDR